MENVAKLGFGRAWVFGLAAAFAMGIPSAIGAQEKEPDSLNLLGKLRDFQEINPKGVGPVHPDFNSDIYIRYGGVGYVKKRIQDALKRNAEVEAKGIRIDVLDGIVTLEGRVKAWPERDAAERAAWSAPGVKAVVDRITVG